MPTLIDAISSGSPTGKGSAPTSLTGMDVASAKQVLRAAAQSGSERALITAVTPSASVASALTVLTSSSDVVSAEDIVLFTGLSGYAADGTPTWGELVTALSS